MVRYLIVNKIIADLRREPGNSGNRYIHDDLQESQVLYNEILSCKDDKDEWYYVEAIEQAKFLPSVGWQGYPGWIKKSDVTEIPSLPSYNCAVSRSMTQLFSAPTDESTVILEVSIGTKLSADDVKASFFSVRLFDNLCLWVRQNDLCLFSEKKGAKKLRADLVKTAKLFTDTPYYWGGRSIHMGQTGPAPFATGVDCSSLVNLVYRANGIDLPRDAHDQWLKATPIAGDKLQGGDLIFIADKNRQNTIVHVMLSLGGEELMEASETGTKVIMKTFYDKFGFSLEELRRRGSLIEGNPVYFGTFL